jgi:hypothetical protein
MTRPRPSDVESTDGTSKLNAEFNALAQAKSVAQAEVDRLTKEIADTEGATTCSKCKQSIVEILKPVLAGLRKSLKAAEKKLATSTEDADESEKQLKAAQRVLDADLKAISDYDSELQTLRDRHNDSMAAWNTLNAEYATAQQSISRHQTEITELTTRMGDQTAQHAKEYLPVLEGRLTTARADYTVAKAKADALRTTVNNVGAECRELIAARAQAQTKASTLAEHAKYKAQSDVLKQSVDMIETMLGGFTDQAVAPILVVANEFCHDILRLPLVYREGQIGMNGPTGWVHNRSFSDSEKLIAYAGICVALAAADDFKLSVIGRFESFDFVNRRKLAARALDLTRVGIVNQVLFIEVQATPNERNNADYGIAPFEKDFSVIVI